ncbi:unnamed protein product, partial [Didymodactylos carnosus]
MANDLHTIQLKEIEPPYMLLKPPSTSAASTGSTQHYQSEPVADIKVVPPNYLKTFKSIGARSVPKTDASDEESDNDYFEPARDTSTKQSAVRNLCLIWLDGNVNKDQDNLALQRKLRQIISLFEVFDILIECERYIQHTKTEEIILIVGGKFGRELVPRIHNLSQLLAVYVYCMDKAGNESWANKCSPKPLVSSLSPAKLQPAVQQLQKPNLAPPYKQNLSQKENKIVEKLRSNDQTLETLNIWGNNISSEGAKALAEALKTNQTLATLDIRNNNISSEGAKAIAEALKTNETLETLNISSNNISDEGAKAIAEAWKTNKNAPEWATLAPSENFYSLDCKGNLIKLKRLY